MNEAIRNAALFLWAFCAVNSEAYAAEPSTIIYGASETAPGVHDSAVVRFRDDEGNIMGQPIDVGGFESAADNGQPPGCFSRGCRSCKCGKSADCIRNIAAKSANKFG